MQSIDLFSGIGALAYALHGVCRPVLYCEVDADARATLRANMARKLIRRAPVHDDVRTLGLAASTSCPKADAVVAGVPCVGFSPFGKRQGFEQEQSALFFDMLRVLDRCGARVLFLENVPNIVASPASRSVLVQELAHKRGFQLRWLVLAASQVGAPHQRRRWFCLGLKGSAAPPSRPPPAWTPFDWGRGEPPRMVRASSHVDQRRWAALGNAVVPDAVRTAYGLLLASPSSSSDGGSHQIAVTTVEDKKTSTIKRSFAKPAASSPLRLTFDPALLPKPDKKSPNQTTPTLRRPVHASAWSTPRHGMTRACRVLTKRSSRDLPTQIVFEAGTRNRAWGGPNPEFGEWLMGLPPGFSSSGSP